VYNINGAGGGGLTGGVSIRTACLGGNQSAGGAGGISGYAPGSALNAAGTRGQGGYNDEAAGGGGGGT
jgi:hypothetical protein